MVKPKFVLLNWFVVIMIKTTFPLILHFPSVFTGSTVFCKVLGKKKLNSLNNQNLKKLHIYVLFELNY